MAKLDISTISHDRLEEVLTLPLLLNSSLDLDVVLQSVMDLASKITRSEASSLLLLDPQEKQLYFKTATGKKAKEVKQFKLKLGEGIAGWVVQTGQSLRVNDVEKNTHYQPDISTSLHFATRSILCVPLKSRKKIIGALEVVNKLDSGSFTEEDQALLELMASQAGLAIENAKLHGELNEENKYLRQTAHLKLIGSSPAFKKVLEMVEKAAPTDATLLIRGESGTGKELLSRYIHEHSKRAHRPFICVTCSILSETLLESELFGHEKGAFTGATAQKKGRFEMANQGTVFLDEIGTLNPNTQLRLLRVLQEKELERVGGNDTIKVNIRIIAATNEDLEKAIKEGRFREDLYYRFKVIEIQLPPLRKRKEDLPDLIRYFLNNLSQEMGRNMREVSAQAMQLLQAYHWPGNIRELKNILERAIVLGSGDLLLPEYLPAELSSQPLRAESAVSLEDAERTQILSILDQTKGNKSKAAQILKISRNRLDRKLKKLNI